MKFHYTKKINAILHEINILNAQMGEDSHAFWMHIDGDKLDQCIKILGDMNLKIDLELSID